jgi:phosphoribosylformylglycinamidine synthase
VEFSPAPHFELDAECRLQATVGRLISSRTITSAHDISEGGLFVTLLESAMPRDMGFEANMTTPTGRTDAFWFGESQSRVVVSVAPENIATFELLVSEDGLPCTRIGSVRASDIVIEGVSWGSIKDWKSTYDMAIERFMSSYHTA